MSKYITLLTILFLSCEGSFRPEKYSENFTSMSYITITSPKGGENWEMGTIDTISWSYNNLVEAPVFSIALYQDGDFLSDIITQPASPGFLAEYIDDVTGARWKAVYGWLIPISLSDSNNYKIRISSFDSAENLVVGESNDHFTLTVSDILMPDLSQGSGCGNWQDAIVVSTSPGDFTEDANSEPFLGGNYYINSVIQNIGTADAVFQDSLKIYKVYLDNVEISSWTYFTGGILTPGSCIYGNDDNTNYLSAGTHELKIVIDPDNNIIEFDENNNIYTRTIEIGTDSDGSCEYVVDCAGVCGGTAAVDCAGVCGGTAAVDCAGVCGGTAAVDVCGVCDGGNIIIDECTSCDSGLTMGCDGICSATPTVLDECNICGGDGSTCAAYITIISPNGGEFWDLGSTQTITWSSSGLARANSSSLIPPSPYKKLIVNKKPNYKKGRDSFKGDKRLKVGNKLNIKKGTSSFQLDKIIQHSDHQSDQNTALSRSKTANIAPIMSQSMVFSSSSNVKIELYSDGSLYEVISNSTDNSGSYSWAISSTYDGGSNYKVRISDASNTALYDESDGSFTLTEPTPTNGYIITSPNGGEVWNEGSTQTITWEILGEYLTSCGSNPCKVYLYYSLNGGESWIEVGHIPYDGVNGEYDWTIPTVYITNPHYLLKVVGSSYCGNWNNSCDHSSFPDYHDISDADFTITASGGSSLITIQSPNGGESWHEGDTETITWSTNGDIGGNTVKIDYSANAGIDWTSVVSSTSNSGSYDWTVPSRSDTTTTALIRISSTSNAALYDANDNYFTMTSDSNYYRILYPNGGEQFQMGTSYYISWISGGDIGAVELYYSEYSGDSWYSIDDNESNDGSYAWLVPTLQSDNSNILVKIVDRSNEAWFDISDATFTISQSVTETYDMDFESGESTIGWTFGGNWTANSTSDYSGSSSAYCTGSSISTMSKTQTSANAGVLGFYFKAAFSSSSTTYNSLKLKIDGVEKFTTSTNQTNWTKVIISVDSGTHTYEWIHDGYSSSSSYYTRIDAISFPEGSVPVNNTPADISISSSSIAENESSGTTVGTLSTTDADAGDSHTYTLVSGTGSTDNSSFTISGSSLKTAVSFDYETKSSYSIRIRTTDVSGLYYEEVFTITVTDANETPTDISISSSSIAENESYGTTVGTLSTTDADAGDSHTYTLVSGTGSTDNGSFTISGSSLKTAAYFDYETKSSYSIRIQTEDNGGETYEEAFTITVTDVSESPCATGAASTMTGTILYPGSGDIIAYGSSMYFGVQWSISGTSQLHIYLYKENNYVKTLATWMINDGYANVNFNSTDVTPGSCYQIVMGGSLYVMGSYFTIQ